jgi:hypothetical protein
MLMILGIGTGVADIAPASLGDNPVEQWEQIPLGTIRHDRDDSSYTGLAAAFPSAGKITCGVGFVARRRRGAL